MKMLTVVTVFTVCTAFCTVAVSAQDTEVERSVVALVGDDADPSARPYSQIESTERRLTLDLLAVNSPESFNDLEVLAANGDAIGTVIAITREGAGNSLQVIVDMTTGYRVAMPLAELTLVALGYYDPAHSLAEQIYEPEQFERLTQYQAGHTARGSLANPAAGVPAARAPAADEGLRLADARASVTEPQEKAGAGSQVRESSAQDSTVADVAYQASGSPIVQLALQNPAGLERKQLLDETGKLLGLIDHIAKHTFDQALYAVIEMNAQQAFTVVRLDALRIATLGYAGSLVSLQQSAE